MLTLARQVPAALLLLLPTLVAQDAPAPRPADAQPDLRARLRLLDAGHTDWALLLDLGDKLEHSGARALPALQQVLEEASGQEDKRYELRLLGLLARVDPPEGTRRLASWMEGEHAGYAAIAARVLGRSGAPVERIAAVLGAQLKQEPRRVVGGAIVLAAADARATALAPLVRERIETMDLDPDALAWHSLALAQLADEAMGQQSRDWLQADSRCLLAGVLLARRFGGPAAEAALLELHAEAHDERLAEWTAVSLGACGGDEARVQLRAALEREAAAAKEAGVHVISGQPDVRQLALLRLQEAGAVTWVRSWVESHGMQERAGITFEVMGPELARLPELIGKWRVADGADLLLRCVAAKAAPRQLRAAAARGLCWSRDGRGLTAAAALLAEGGDPQRDLILADALGAAQTALHEFIGNPSRPDYVPIERLDEAGLRELGRRWQEWLRANEAQVEWRERIVSETDHVMVF